MHVSGSPDLPPATCPARPLVVAHRGASAYRPEHTAASYELAIELGADLVEPDVMVTRDGALVVRHDRQLSLSTDIADHPEFAHRRRVKTVRGVAVRDWFVEDFDLAELRTLGCIEPDPDVRPLNTAYDGSFGVMTLEEVIDLVLDRATPGRDVGVLVELAPFLEGPGEDLPALLAAELRRLGVASGDGPITLQSFEPEPLAWLREDLGSDCPPLVRLVHDGPAFDDLLTARGLREISTYAHGIGPNLDRVMLRDADGFLASTSDLVDRSHDADLAVFVWKLRPENAFLPRQFRLGEDPRAHGNSAAEAEALVDLGVDALITDAPEVAARVCRLRQRDAALV